MRLVRILVPVLALGAALGLLTPAASADGPAVPPPAPTEKCC